MRRLNILSYLKRTRINRRNRNSKLLREILVQILLIGISIGSFLRLDHRRRYL